ncbi:MAG: flagellar protein [Armatimonadetes bacterium]|nr:flagellar protein [Armatimonadota bacterium]
MSNVIRGINPAVHKTVSAPQSPTGRTDFSTVLAQETQRLDSLRISSHAQKRLASSRVELSASDIRRIDQAVERASAKGSNQSLVMLDNLALVVSVKNRVVITAIDEARTREGIFTNIDSVVIA